MNNPSDENRIIEVEGKHGLIRMVIPNRQPTQEELATLYKIIAETIINSEKEEIRPIIEAAN